jgi:hypothetical protein
VPGVTEIWSVPPLRLLPVDDCEAPLPVVGVVPPLRGVVPLPLPPRLIGPPGVVVVPVGRVPPLPPRFVGVVTPVPVVPGFVVPVAVVPGFVVLDEVGVAVPGFVVVVLE